MFDDFKLIHSYTRADAIRDGVLIDVSEMAKEAGFRIPVAITAAVYAEYVKVPAGVVCQDEAGRCWDILWLCNLAARKAKGSVILYSLHVRNDNCEGTPPRVTLKGVCGPGDDGSPCVTIMLVAED